MKYGKHICNTKLQNNTRIYLQYTRIAKTVANKTALPNRMKFGTHSHDIKLKIGLKIIHV